MARKKSQFAVPAVVRESKTLAGNGRALSPNERNLNFGERWPYARAPEQSDYIQIKPRYHLLDGKFRAPHSGVHFDSINPATEGKLAEIAEAGAHDVDLAVGAARRAHSKVWSKMPGRERGKYLYRIARLIQEKTRELAILESMDGGKTIKEAAPGIGGVPALRWRGRRCSRGTLSPELAVARQPSPTRARVDVVVAHDAVSGSCGRRE